MLIAKAGGLRVAGAAVLPPGLEAPSVGDCLGAISGSLSTVAGAGRPSAISIDSVSITSVTMIDCDREHVGEVVAFHRMPALPEGVAVATANADAASSDGQWCQQIASDYRSQSNYWFGAASAGLWVPSVGQRFVVILSAPSDDPARLPWAACAVVAPGLEAYLGSYIGSLALGSGPAPFGLCRSGDRADGWVSCAGRHREQVFGSAIGQASQARRNATCRNLIEAMTGMPDISAAGALRLVVDGGADQSSSSDTATCRLATVGDRWLLGSLIDVGRGPLPLG